MTNPVETAELIRDALDSYLTEHHNGGSDSPDFIHISAVCTPQSSGMTINMLALSEHIAASLERLSSRDGEGVEAVAIRALLSSLEVVRIELFKKDGMSQSEAEAAAWAEWTHPANSIRLADAALAAIQPPPGDGEPPETVYKAVERVLDENSAWIARPNAEVTKKVALAAGIAWSLHAPHEPNFADAEPGQAKAAGDASDKVYRCFICDRPIYDGDMALNDVSGDIGHRDCFGDEREGFVRDIDTGEALGPDDPLPTGYRWNDPSHPAAPNPTDAEVEGQDHAGLVEEDSARKIIDGLTQAASGDLGRVRHFHVGRRTTSDIGELLNEASEAARPPHIPGTLGGLITRLANALATTARERDEMREALKPFAALAEKFGRRSVVEVCDPHPDNPSRNIGLLYVDHLRRAAALTKEPRHGQ